MELLDGAIRHYAWGSRTAIPELLGRPATDDPVAEVWFGAHPTAPARTGANARRLDEVIGGDAVGALGPAAARRFGELPFLFKIIAAAQPLSLQAHPSTEQALAGFERETEAGIPIDAPERSFRDRSHKPELVCALSEFEALCGFRTPEESLARLATVATSALDPLRDRLSTSPAEAAIREALTWLLTLGHEDAQILVRAVVEAGGEDPESASAPAALARRLAASHPADAGVVSALLLHRVVLQPGEALFLGSGTLHCYLSGTAVEVMANSDNVVRGGLTSKHIDVATLLEIVDTRPAVPAVQRPPLVDGVARYDSPVPEFALARIEVDGDGTGVEVEGPAILLCVDGVVDAGRHTLERGEAAWLPAADPPLPIVGQGTVFRAGVGRLDLQ